MKKLLWCFIQEETTKKNIEKLTKTLSSSNNEYFPMKP